MSDRPTSTDSPSRAADGARPPLSPGDPVAVHVAVGPLGVFWVRHVGIVSRVAGDEVFVISSSARRGACHEETLEEFSCGGEAYRLPIDRRVDADETLRRARSLLGAPWRLLSANCEHVVSWCAGHEPKSPQLRAFCRAAVHTAAVAATAVLAIARRRARA